tara:strand:+ start:3841 stop:5100 length:1260 start_codon:yes stop_codon:yes gene_type:complete
MKKYLFIILLFSFWSCEDKEDTVDSTLITATFKNNWVRSDIVSYLAVHSLDGTLLADTSFTGNTSFSLNTADGESAPDRILVTTITTDEYDNVEVVTNAGIKSDVNWIWEGVPDTYDDDIGVSEYTFVNMSDFDRAVISANNSYVRTGNGMFDETYSLVHRGPNNTEDVLLMAYKTDGSGYYKLFQDVEAGNSTIEVDGNELIPATYKLIDNNTSEVADAIFIDAYENNESNLSANDHRLKYRGYYPDQDYDENGDFHAHYPPIYSKYKTGITTGVYGNSDTKYWYQRTYGDIPNSVEKINADFELINSSSDNFEISTTGVFDNAYFLFSGENDYTTVNWMVFVNPEILDEFNSLPSMSSDAMPYSGLANTSFTLIRISLTDYLCVEDNDTWTDLLFSDGYIWDKCSELRDVTYRMPSE